MSEELKPCPFCGGKAQHQWHSGPCWIECETCNAVGPADAETTTEQNEAAWNARTPPPPTLHREPIEADREARKEVLAFLIETLDTPCSDGDMPDDRNEQLDRIFMRHRLAFSTPAASDAEAMARALKAAHEALSRANVTAYLDMPEDTADVVARAVIAALLLPKAGEMETETAFEIWEDDLMVASASTEAEGLHYFAVYSQDGPVKLVRAETVRQVITTPSTEGHKGEDQA